MKTSLSFPDIAQRVRRAEIPEVDIVVGIATGGVVPASLIAFHNNLPLSVIHLNYRDEQNNPRYDEPQLQAAVPLTDERRRILLVDDVSVSGKTLEKAKELLEGKEITTLVMKGKGDIVLFPEVKTCVNWPWKMGVRQE